MSDAQQQPQGQAPYGYPSPAPTVTTENGGSMGLVALIVGVVAIVISLAYQPLVTVILMNGGDPSLLQVASLTQGAILFVVSGVALVLGIIAVRTGARRMLGAVAIGIGATQLSVVVVGWAVSAIMSLILG